MAGDIAHSALLTLPGAVPADGLDTGVAWHYGDPLREQRSASERAGLFDRSHRGLLAVTGEDRLTWLNTLTSQLLLDLPDGAVTELLVLDAQGHIDHFAGVTVLGDTVYLDTEPGAATRLAAHLERMKFWSKVSVRDAGGDLAQFTVAGPACADMLAGVAGLQPAHPDTGTAVALPGGGFARAQHNAIDLFVPRGEFPALAKRFVAAGAAPAGSWAADALRIPTRQPRFGVDNDERTIPNESSWLDTAVHLHKGCYCGQETVARVANLGRPPRRMVMLNLDGSADSLPVTGGPVTTSEGRTVGRVGTVAQHFEYGPIALALVKRNIGPGLPLLAAGVDAAVDPDDAVADSPPPTSAIDHRAFAAVRRPATPPGSAPSRD